MHDLVAVYEKEHIVQYYPNEEILLKNLKSFIGGGILVHDPCVVIATKEHSNELAQQLGIHGIDIKKCTDSGVLTMLDAQKTLDSFMVNDMPDSQLFREVVGKVLNSLNSRTSTIRAFGEMVALLSGAGNYKGAIHLEKLWNELASGYSLTLFCAYPSSHFESLQQQSQIEFIDEISNLHGRVISTETLLPQSQDQAFPNYPSLGAAQG